MTNDESDENLINNFKIEHAYHREIMKSIGEVQVVYFNICSARNKMDQIEAFINDPHRNVVALVLTETWFLKGKVFF